VKYSFSTRSSSLVRCRWLSFVGQWHHKIGVTRCANWWCHLFSPQNWLPFDHHPTDYLHHSHLLCLSRWSFVQCSCKFIRQKIFGLSLRCQPLDDVTRGGPLPSDATSRDTSSIASCLRHIPLLVIRRFLFATVSSPSRSFAVDTLWIMPTLLLVIHICLTCAKLLLTTVVPVMSLYSTSIVIVPVSPFRLISVSCVHFYSFTYCLGPISANFLSRSVQFRL